MDDIRPVGRTKLEAREQTRASLLETLASLSAGTPTARTPEELADLIRANYQTNEGDAAWGFAAALDALDKAVLWEPALTDADPNPDRFRDAARHIAAKALAAARPDANWPASLREVLGGLAALGAHDEVAPLAGLLRRTPIPAATTDVLRPPRRDRPRPAAPTPAARPTPTVLLRFQLDGVAASWPISLTPGRTYDLQAQVSVDAWPNVADHLMIELDTDVPSSVIGLPTIKVPAGADSGRGYLVPKREIGRTNPVTFTPRATFVGADGLAIPANIVGHRSLRVSTFDPIAVGVGRPMVAQRIVELLGELDSRITNLPDQDRRDLINLLEATDRFAAFANERPDLLGLDERGFQAKLKQALVMDRAIGTRIQEAPKLGSGTTDLLLGRIVDELKISHSSIDIDDADRFVRQPTQYASAGDCPISMLTVLDDSPKTDPPGIASNYMRWAFPQIHGTTNPHTASMVVVVIIPIGFPVPSYWSTLAPGPVEHGP
jgi:hypothetical protein